MPFIEVDELPEGAVGADVVPRTDYDAKVGELGEVTAQRDELLGRAESAERDLKSARDAYARAFLANDPPAKTGAEPEPEPVNTYDRLFA